MADEWYAIKNVKRTAVLDAREDRGNPSFFIKGECKYAIDRIELVDDYNVKVETRSG